MTAPPSFADKFTDVLIKLLIAGSGSSALYFLYVNELPKAAIAGLVSAGTALLTSFGEGIMAKLKGDMKRQGELVGEVTTEAVGSARDLAWAKLSGLSQQYQTALKAHCYAVEVEGFQDLPGLALEDVFVPLRIESAGQRLTELSGPQEIWDFLPKRYQQPAQSPHRRMVILAAPGYGKTTLMRHLTLTFVTDPPETVAELMPILLRFRDVHPLMRLPAFAADSDPEDPDTALSLPALIIRHLANQAEFQAAKPTPTWLRDQLQKGTCLVLLDGLDEIPREQRQAVRQWVDYQMKLYQATQFILTPRPHGFELSPDDPSHPITVDTKLRVLDFTPDQKQEFVEKWYRTLLWRLDWEPLYLSSQKRPASAQLDEAAARIQSDQKAQTYASDLIRQIVNSPALNDLARNPLLITMIASTHRAQTVLPKRRVELYDKIFDLLLGTRPYAKKTPLTLTATKNKVVLQELAWNLVQAEATQFTQPQCEAWLAAVLNRCTKDDSFTPAQFLTEMTDVAGMVVEKERDYYEFAHQTFQEYLAAKYLREPGNDGETQVKAQLANDRWQEVIRFYAALGDATPIIEALMVEGADERALLLAGRCMEEGREVEQTTVTKLQERLETLNLRRLEEAAATQQTGHDETLVLEEVVQGIDTAEPAIETLTYELRLKRRFSSERLHPLTATADITNPITWGEYKLFLEAQQKGQFHSQASIVNIASEQENQPVTHISWEDARWFCAWLSIHNSLQEEEDKTFDYHLPTDTERQTVEPLSQGRWGSLKPLTANPQTPGNMLMVVRRTVSVKYATLINYLTNGRWQEADEETYQVMTKVAGGRLTTRAIREFPCEDLRMIDQLWVKFSGGLFGFSVQKQLYVETGNPLDGEYHEETWYKFCEVNGWCVNSTYRDYSDLIFSTNAPAGHLPGRVIGRGLGWFSQVRGPGVIRHGAVSIFSRAQTCEL